MASAEVDVPPGYHDPRFFGRGDRATVYRCVETAGDDEVALKLFDRPLDDLDGGAAAFRYDCRLAWILGAHTGVITVRAAGVTASGHPWLAMDLAVNGPLATLIEHSGGTLPLAHALDITATLADTLGWAHQLESPVIHGDISPATVLLDAEWRPRLSFASADDRQPAKPYAAPEELRDHDQSVASDIWSLTATMFEMITGAAPFVMAADEDPGDFIDRVERGLPATAIDEAVPPVVASILRDGLTADRDQRIPSMALLAQAVRAAQIQLKLRMAAPLLAPEPDPDAKLRFVNHAEPTAPAAGAPRPPVDEDIVAAPAAPRRRRQRRRVWVTVAAALVLGLTGTGIAVASSTHGPAPQAGGSPTGADGSSTPTPAGATFPAPGPTTPSPKPTSRSTATSGAGPGIHSTNPPPTTTRPQPTTPDPITGFTVVPTGADGQATVTFDAPAAHGAASTVTCYVDTTGCGTWSVPVGGAAGLTRTIGGLPNGQQVTVRLQDCNGNTFGKPCDTEVQAPVTAYGPMNGLAVTPSASGPTVNFTIAVNPNGKPATVQVTTSRQTQTFTTDVTAWTWSGSDDMGYGANDTITVTVTDAGRTTLSQQVSQSTPPPPPTVTVSRGTPCGGGGGAACTGGTCSSPSCAYIHVVTANFTGNVSCTFGSDRGSSGWVQNVTWGPNQSKDSPNWYGFSGTRVYVNCGGVHGSFTWP